MAILFSFLTVAGLAFVAFDDLLLAPVSGMGRHADLPMDLRGTGLAQGSSRFNKLESFLSSRYGAKVSFDSTASFGRIDELTGTIHLNRGTATFDVVAHELSHVRFAQAMGKWGTGKRLTNFEVNLMESIGYYGTYRKGIASGLCHADALANSSFGPAFDTLPDYEVENWLSDLHDRNWVVWSAVQNEEKLNVVLACESMPISDWPLKLVLQSTVGTISVGNGRIRATTTIRSSSKRPMQPFATLLQNSHNSVAHPTQELKIYTLTIRS